jgi:hypothetical protein
MVIAPQVLLRALGVEFIMRADEMAAAAVLWNRVAVCFAVIRYRTRIVENKQLPWWVFFTHEVIKH